MASSGDRHHDEMDKATKTGNFDDYTRKKNSNVRVMDKIFFLIKVIEAQSTLGSNMNANG